MRLAVLASVLLIGCGDVRRPDGGVGLLPVGSAAPDIVARGPDKAEVRLSSMRGKVVVVYFYPADGTPGCTEEACAFRDAWSRFEKANVGILGVSTNDAERHEKFQKEEHLPFALAADESGTVGAAYGVKKKLWGYDRVSFLVDPAGKIARVWPSVDPGVHAEQVLAEAKKLAD
jgi:thioredoxin-dependent peroxiredoxin